MMWVTLLTSDARVVQPRAVAQLMGVMKAGSAGQRTARAQLVSRSTASSAASMSRLLAGRSISLAGPSSSNTCATCASHATGSHGVSLLGRY